MEVRVDLLSVGPLAEGMIGAGATLASDFTEGCGGGCSGVTSISSRRSAVEARCLVETVDSRPLGTGYVRTECWPLADGLRQRGGRS